MKNQTVHGTIALALIILVTTLGGCSSSLPSDAQTILIDAFERDQKPNIISAQQVEPLQEDLALGAEEVWCVQVSFVCWSCDYGEYQTCADSRLARRVGDEWQISLVLTEGDKNAWKARGCQLAENKVQ